MAYSDIALLTEGTDFDQGAERLALALAARWKAKLRIVFPLISNAEYELAAPLHAARAEEQARLTCARIGEAARQVGVETERAIRRGIEPVQAIVGEIQRARPGLLVARRRGKRGFLSHLLVGEMVSAVARQVSCPTLLVPRDARPWEGNVLAAVQSWPRDRGVVSVAMQLAVEGPLPRLTVSVDASIPPGASASETAAILQGRSLACQCHTESGDFAAALVNRARQCAAQLLVLAREPSKGGHAQRLDGLPLDLVGKVNCPVLLLPVEV